MSDENKSVQGGGSSDGGGRFQQLESQQQAEEQQEQAIDYEAFRAAQREELTTKEKQALGHLAEPLEELRKDEGPEPSLTQWRQLMQTVYSEATRSDLTALEKKQVLQDIYLAQRGKRNRLLLGATLGLAAIAAIIATALL
jgi:DNA-binding SARP family transcriptional activator